MLGKLLFLTVLACSHAGVTRSVFTKPHPDCPPTGHHLLPHEYDCTKFYYCEYGEKWIAPRDCALGTEFSAELQVCIHPAQANCHLPGYPQTPPEEISTEATPVTEAATTSEPEYTETTSAPETDATITSIPIITSTVDVPITTLEPVVTDEPTTSAPVTNATVPSVPIGTVTTAAPVTNTTVTSIPIITSTAEVSSTSLEPEVTEIPDVPTTILEPVVTEEPTTSAPVTNATVPSIPIGTVTTAAPVTNATVTSIPIITSTAEVPSTSLEPEVTEIPDFPTTILEPVVTEEPTTSTPVTTVTVPSVPIGTVTTAAPVTNATVTSIPIITSTAEVPSTSLEPGVTEIPDVPTTILEPVVTEEPTTSTPVTTVTVPSVPIGTVTTAAPVTNATVTSIPIITSTAEVPSTSLEPGVTEIPDVPTTILEPVVTEEPTTSVPVTNATVPSVPIGTVTTAAPVTNATVTSVPIGTVTTSAPVTNATVTSVPIVTSPLPTTPEESPSSPDLLPNGCPADRDVHKLLPHETDCDKFYYCVDGKKVLRECARGTYFNYAIQVCDWPENVECANSGSSTTPAIPEAESSDETNPEHEGILPNGCPADFNVHQLLPHQSQCNKFYYCVNGDKVERECAEGLHFNADIQVCDWPSQAGCIVEEDSVEGSGDEPDIIDVLPNGCPVDSNIHQLLPHESDCNKFYYCVHGNKVERSCAPGLDFNPVIQTCDWPSEAGCSNVGNGGDSQESSGNGQDSNESSDNGQEQPETGAVLPNGCPADFDIHQLLPHESKCNKFYYCVHGEKVERECNAGLHFNPSVQACDWPTSAGCTNAGGDNSESQENSGNGQDSNEGSGNGQDSTESSGNGQGSTESSGNGQDSTESSGNGEDSNEATTNAPEAGTLLPNGCSADFDIHQLLPHESECNKFYYCVHGNKVERECSPGLHFNPVLEICDHPESAGCNGSNGNGTETDNGGEDGTVINPEHPDNSKCEQCNVLPWAHEKDCDKYWICNGGNATLITCSEGLHFNAKTLTCDLICNAKCTRASVQTTIENDGLVVFFPWRKVDGELENMINKKM